MIELHVTLYRKVSIFVSERINHKNIHFITDFTTLKTHKYGNFFSNLKVSVLQAQSSQRLFVTNS